jgi:general secretion pathway protein G
MLELLVTLAIIATLAAVVAPMLFRHVGDARTRSAQSQLQVLGLALDSYRLDNGAYPTVDQGLQALRVRPTTGEVSGSWRGPYVRQEIPDDPWGRPFVYLQPGVENPDAYDLFTLGRDGRAGGEGEDADVTSWGGPVRQ